MSARSLVDQPDDYSGSQVHVIYAVPKGGIDQQLDVTSKIPFSIGAINRWLETQINRKVKFDTYKGDLDIQFVQLPRTDAEYSATGDKLFQIRFDIPPTSATNAAKNLLVFYDGSGSAAECGRSTQPQSVRGPQFSAVFLKGGLLPKYPCWTDPATGADAAATLDDRLALHELFHGLGADHPPAATATPGSDDFYKQECDLMYPFGTTECVGRMVLDPFQLFYYSPKGFADGRVNTYDSPYLTPPPTN